MVVAYEVSSPEATDSPGHSARTGAPEGASASSSSPSPPPAISWIWLYPLASEPWLLLCS